MKKRVIGLALGAVVAAVVWFLPIGGLSLSGRRFFALTLMTVIFWAFEVAHPGYVSGLFLGLLIILGIERPEVVLYAWQDPLPWMVIGSYLIASAVRSSGLGERIAYWFILRFVRSFTSIIVTVFLLLAVLSLIVPHPWPRSFLVMSVMGKVIESAQMGKREARAIGFSVFAASIPTGLIFLTGTSNMNRMVPLFAGRELGWAEWVYVMGVPGIALSALTCGLVLLVFRPKSPLQIDRESVRRHLAGMGSIRGRERRVLIWLGVSILLWSTDSLHGIDIAWLTLVIAMLMAFPLGGELLHAQSWREVSIHTLIFLTAAMTIGRVGETTGMTEWIATHLLPAAMPGNVYLLALVVALLAMSLHLILGSTITTISVAVPALLHYASTADIPALPVALWAYTAVFCHYLFPFHHMNLLVGVGGEGGGFSQRETLRISGPLALAVLLGIVCVQIPWWRFIGILP